MLAPDTYREAFHRFVESGMTYSEALDQFDISEFMAAALLQIDNGEGMELVSLYGKAHRERMNEFDMNKAIELWMAGWKSETPFKTQADIMSWYWRRPPKGHRKIGRRFLSTDQAWNALKRESV